MRLYAALLLLLLAAPAGANHVVLEPEPGATVAPATVTVAATSGAYEVVTWANETRDVLGFDVRPQSTYEVTNRTHLIQAHVSLYWTETQTGVGRLALELDGVEITDCFMLARTINGQLLGVVGASQNQAGANHHVLICSLPELALGAHNVTARFTTHSGNPNTVAVIDYAAQVLQIDYNVIDMKTDFELLTGLSAAEFLILPLLAVLGLFLWTRQDLGVRIFGVFLVLFDMALVYAVFASAGGRVWPGLFVMVFVLLLAAAWMAIQLAVDVRKARRGKV